MKFLRKLFSELVKWFADMADQTKLKAIKSRSDFLLEEAGLNPRDKIPWRELSVENPGIFVELSMCRNAYFRVLCRIKRREVRYERRRCQQRAVAVR